jgi:uncharacterized protein Yka (UPF0111/DUF47 family)
MSEDLIHIMATEPGAQRTALLEKLVLQERANDDLTHTIFKELARNFITPIDREDIHSISRAAWTTWLTTFWPARRTWSCFHIDPSR